jgi:hypothetical protein
MVMWGEEKEIYTSSVCLVNCAIVHSAWCCRRHPWAIQLFLWAGDLSGRFLEWTLIQPQSDGCCLIPLGLLSVPFHHSSLTSRRPNLPFSTADESLPHTPLRKVKTCEFLLLSAPLSGALYLCP